MKTKTKEQFVKEATIVHKGIYGYDKVEYINAHTKINIFCKACNNYFFQTPAKHTNSKHGCPTCGTLSMANKCTSTKEEFVEKAIKVHKDKYGYEDVDYINSKIKVNIFCKACNNHFKQISNCHLSGNGCPTCGIISNSNDRRTTTEEFVKEATIVHKGIYGYDKVEYINAHTKINIFCKACNNYFFQTPANHIHNQHGCPTCGTLSMANKRTSTKEEFVEKAIKVHKDKYGYEDVDYINSKIKVNIFCKKCRKHFPQTPRDHINHNGCPTCSSAKGYSDISIKWLESIMTEHKIHIQYALNEGEYKIPETSWRVDGFCVETNTIYEFHGDFWHGNPIKFNHSDMNIVTKTTFGELYENTQKRKQELIAMGYNYVEMWEYDWKKDGVINVIQESCEQV